MHVRWPRSIKHARKSIHVAIHELVLVLLDLAFFYLLIVHLWEFLRPFIRLLGLGA